MPENDDLDAAQGADLVQDRQPWDRMPTESDKAFAAFAAYRDLERRSFKTIAERLNCSPQNIFQWSSKVNWRGRCDAYDVEQDRLQRAEFARNRTRMRERHRALGVALGGIAAHGVREWQAKIASGAELNLQPEQLVMLAKCALELERSTLELDGDHAPTSISIFLGTHRYADEAGYTGEKAEGAVEWKTLEAVESEQYQRLLPEEQAQLSTWKNPPKRKALKRA